MITGSIRSLLRLYVSGFDRAHGLTYDTRGSQALESNNFWECKLVRLGSEGRVERIYRQKMVVNDVVAPSFPSLSSSRGSRRIAGITNHDSTTPQVPFLDIRDTQQYILLLTYFRSIFHSLLFFFSSHATAMVLLPACNLLRGKTAIVTGGVTGIGRAITLAYLRQGANVVVGHLGLKSDEGHKDSLVEEAGRLKEQQQQQQQVSAGIAATIGELVTLAGDVAEPETGDRLVRKAVERWGGLDVCVANAGVFKPRGFLE